MTDLETRTALTVQLYENMRARLNSQTQLAILALQSLILINGGALVALFSLIAQGGNTPFIRHIYPPTLWISFAMFALGISAALIAVFLGYWSQNEINMTEQVFADRDRNALLGHAPDPQDQPMADKMLKRANLVFDLAFCVAGLSLILFISGSCFALWASFGALTRA